MPPSPRLTAELNPAKWSELLASMGFTDGGPRMRFTSSTRARGSKEIVHAVYYPLQDAMEVHVNLSEFETDKLRHVSTRITKSLLHETRHAWQLRAWGPERYFKDDERPYELRQKEIDANHFADTNVHLWYGIVRIKRTVPRGGFSKLSRHATGRIV